MKLLASSKGLPVNTVPKHKFGGGRRKKTSNTTDKLIKRGGKKSKVNSPGAKKYAPKAHGKCGSVHHPASPAKRVGLAQPQSCQKTTVNAANEKAAHCVCKKIHPLDTCAVEKSNVFG